MVTDRNNSVTVVVPGGIPHSQDGFIRKTPAKKSFTDITYLLT